MNKTHIILIPLLLLGTLSEGTAQNPAGISEVDAPDLDEVTLFIREMDSPGDAAISTKYDTKKADSTSLKHLYRMQMYYTKAWLEELEGETGTEAQFYGILEGSVEGEQINGRFHIANFPRRRTDGNFMPDAGGVMETEDGATIMLEMRGVSYYSDEGSSPQVVFGVQHYTGAKEYRWLNNRFTVAVGEMQPREDDGPTEFIYDIYVVNWAPRPESY